MMLRTALVTAVAGATLFVVAASEPARAADTGRLVSTYNKPTASGPGVYRTSDGGSTWTSIRPAAETPFHGFVSRFSQGQRVR
jgi:hypothetical protein